MNKDEIAKLKAIRMYAKNIVEYVNYLFKMGGNLTNAQLEKIHDEIDNLTEEILF